MDSSKQAQRAVIQFLPAEGVSGTDIYSRIKNVYGTECMSRTAVFRWCSDFRHGLVSTADSHDQVKHMWFRTQPKTFFADGIHRLVDQWDTCFNQEGDYV